MELEAREEIGRPKLVPPTSSISGEETLGGFYLREESVPAFGSACPLIWLWFILQCHLLMAIIPLKHKLWQCAFLLPSCFQSSGYVEKFFQKKKTFSIWVPACEEQHNTKPLSSARGCSSPLQDLIDLIPATDPEVDSIILPVWQLRTLRQRKLSELPAFLGLGPRQQILYSNPESTA